MIDGSAGEHYSEISPRPSSITRPETKVPLSESTRRPILQGRPTWSPCEMDSETGSNTLLRVVLHLAFFQDELDAGVLPSWASRHAPPPIL